MVMSEIGKFLFFSLTSNNNKNQENDQRSKSK
jgi:hypothetical protein